MRSKRKKFTKKYRRNADLPGRPKSGRPPGVPWSAAKKNPVGIEELMMDMVLPGFGGFAGTRVVTRIAGGIASKRGSRWAPHISVLASLVTTALLWAGAHRIKKTSHYAIPLVVGSSLATLQTMVQTFLPAKYAWLIGHIYEDGQTGLPAGAQSATGEYDQMLDQAQGASDDYTYDDQMDADAPPAQKNGKQQRVAASGKKAQGDDELDDLMGDLDEDDYGAGNGIFANN